MLIVEEHTSFEWTVKNSRFLSEVFSVENADEAREKLREQKERYKDATHVVHAFIVGPERNVMGCSDDGEPAGTSGRPVLEVLKGTGVTNVILTVTRWFGGTKLGTGGLVKAYTECAQGVVALMKIRESVPMVSFSFAVSYALYDQVKKLLVAVGAEEINETFQDEIEMAGRLRASDVPLVESQLRDLTRGKTGLNKDGNP